MPNIKVRTLSTIIIFSLVTAIGYTLFSALWQATSLLAFVKTVVLEFPLHCVGFSVVAWAFGFGRSALYKLDGMDIAGIGILTGIAAGVLRITQSMIVLPMLSPLGSTGDPGFGLVLTYVVASQILWGVLGYLDKDIVVDFGTIDYVASMIRTLFVSTVILLPVPVIFMLERWNMVILPYMLFAVALHVALSVFQMWQSEFRKKKTNLLNE